MTSSLIEFPTLKVGFWLRIVERRQCVFRFECGAIKLFDIHSPEKVSPGKPLHVSSPEIESFERSCLVSSIPVFTINRRGNYEDIEPKALH